MDREVYKSFSEMMRMTSFKIVLCIKASYYPLLCEFTSDVSDAFQSTRTADIETKDGKPIPDFYHE